MTPDATRARITKARPRPAVECTVAISATTWNCASCIREGRWRERLRQEVAQDPFRAFSRHRNGNDRQRRRELGERLTTHATGRRRFEHSEPAARRRRSPRPARPAQRRCLTGTLRFRHCTRRPPCRQWRAARRPRGSANREHTRVPSRPMRPRWHLPIHAKVSRHDLPKKRSPAPAKRDPEPVGDGRTEVRKRSALAEIHRPDPTPTRRHQQGHALTRVIR